MFRGNHVGDLLISGNGTLARYLTQKMKEISDVDSYEENEATYLGMEITETEKTEISKNRF